MSPQRSNESKFKLLLFCKSRCFCRQNRAQVFTSKLSNHSTDGSGLGSTGSAARIRPLATAAAPGRPVRCGGPGGGDLSDGGGGAGPLLALRSRRAVRRARRDAGVPSRGTRGAARPGARADGPRQDQDAGRPRVSFARHQRAISAASKAAFYDQMRRSMREVGRTGSSLLSRGREAKAPG